YRAHESSVRSVPKRSKTPWREHFFDRSTDLLKMVKVVAASIHANAQPAENKAEKMIGSVERVEHVPNLSPSASATTWAEIWAGLSFGRPSERLLDHAHQYLKVVRFQHSDCAGLNRVVSRFWITGDKSNFQCRMALPCDGAKCDPTHSRQADVTEHERNVVSLIKHAQSIFTGNRSDDLVAHDGHHAGQRFPVVRVIFDKEDRRHRSLRLVAGSQRRRRSDCWHH